MKGKKRTVNLTPEREALYKEARKKAQQILDICDAILVSKETEAHACGAANFPVASFRQFCKHQPKSFGDKIRVEEGDWDDWREELLHEITEEEVPVPDDFDEIFEDICKSQLNERTAKILRMRFEDRFDYEAIGKVFGVTRERIRQLIVRALRTLRRPDLRNRLVYGARYSEALSQNKAAQAEYDRLWLKAQEAAKEKINAELDALQRGTDELRKTNEALASDIGVTVASSPTLEDRMKETPIDALELSPRSYRCLRYYFYPSKATAWDVANLSSENLMMIRHLGRKSIAEIESILIEKFGHGFFCDDETRRKSNG